jgi:hypothetical protein
MARHDLIPVVALVSVSLIAPACGGDTIDPDATFGPEVQPQTSAASERFVDGSTNWAATEPVYAEHCTYGIDPGLEVVDPSCVDVDFGALAGDDDDLFDFRLTVDSSDLRDAGPSPLGSAPLFVEITVAPPEETAASWAVFEFACLGADDCAFACRMAYEGEITDPEPCTAPHLVKDLAPGWHLFEVVAIDSAGRHASAEHTWLVDGE